jgi:TonB family protein
MDRRIRRLAVFGVLAFVVASALLHFIMGSTATVLFPRWRYDVAPDETISIISLSHSNRVLPTPHPTPPPSPPKIVLRTSTHLAPLKYREIMAGAAKIAGAIKPPARRKSNIIIANARLPKPGVGEAPAVSNAVQPTPSPGSAGARVDTGGSNDELNGATVWGDDNPPRVIHLAPLALTTTPQQPVRIAVEVGPDGNVISVKLLQSSGDPSLDAAALDSARKTIFMPATLNGLPVHGSVIIEYPAASSST